MRRKLLFASLLAGFLLVPAGAGSAREAIQIESTLIFDPPAPRLGQPFTVVFQSQTPYVYVELGAGPATHVRHGNDPWPAGGRLGPDEVSGSGPYTWVWHAVAVTQTGTYTFTFHRDCPPGPGCQPVASGTLTVDDVEDTPLRFTPARPGVGEPFTVDVSLQAGLAYVELGVDPREGVWIGGQPWPEERRGPDSVSGSGPYTWTWAAITVTQPGGYTFTFYQDCPPGPGCRAVVAETVAVGPIPGDGAVVYLPLVARQETTFHELDDAGDFCPGTPVQIGHQYRDRFGASNDNDWYAFEAQEGQTYTLETSDLENRADTRMALYAADCTTKLAENDDVSYPEDRSSRIVWTAAQDGRYCVSVSSYDWRVYGAGTGYTFGVVEGAAVSVVNLAVSPAKPAPPPLPALGGTDVR